MSNLPASPSLGPVEKLPPVWIQYLVVALLAGLVAYWNLGVLDLEEHEAYAVSAGQNMLRTDRWILPETVAPDPVPAPTAENRWLIPINNGQPRLVKTPLPYWLIAACSAITGQSTPWSGRLYSATAGMLCAIIVLALGRRLLPPRAALLGAVIFATSAGLLRWGHSARPEMLLTMCMALAMLLFWMGLNARGAAGRIGWMLAFWVCMGLANLAKQFYPLLIGPGLLAYVAWQWPLVRADGPAKIDSRRLLLCYVVGTLAALVGGVLAAKGLHLVWRGPDAPESIFLAVMGGIMMLPLAYLLVKTRPWRPIWALVPTAVPGILIMLALFVPWMWYMHKLFGRADHIFEEQVSERAAGTGMYIGRTVRSPLYYVWPMVQQCLPWAILLPGAMCVAFMERFREHRRGLAYLMMWAVGLICLVSVTSEKHEHYILPALPALCILMGFAANDLFFEHKWLSAKLGHRLAIGFGVIGLLAPAAPGLMLLILHDPDGWTHRAQVLSHVMPKTAFGQVQEFIQHPPGGADMWTRLLLVGLLLALPMLVLLLYRRRRMLLTVPMVAITVTMVYVTFYSIDVNALDKEEFAEMGRAAAGIVPPNEGVLALGRSHMRLVYYFGRDIPWVNWTENGVFTPDGRKLPADYFKNPDAPRWLFAEGVTLKPAESLGYGTFIGPMASGRGGLALMVPTATMTTSGDEPRPTASRPATTPSSGPRPGAP